MRDYEALASELIRTLRGRRSQLAVSRRLGYATNAVYTWEAGAAWPTAARFFAFARAVGVPPERVLRDFFRVVPPRLARALLTSPQGIAALLAELKGQTRLAQLAREAGISRFALSRWLGGKGEPKLPEFLRFVEYSSLRLLDLLDALVGAERLTTVRADHLRLSAARRIGYEYPISQAVLRTLETAEYVRRAHQPGWIAAVLGIPLELEQACLSKLKEAGQITWRRGRWRPNTAALVDFRRDPEASQQLKAYWAALAAEHTKTRRPGLFAYNIFAVSRRDLARLETLQRDCLQQMRTIIAASEPSEVVALFNVQLFAFGARLQEE
jgi:transcriptional regulator with XRE-family HTH domain